MVRVLMNINIIHITVVSVIDIHCIMHYLSPANVLP